MFPLRIKNYSTKGGTYLENNTKQQFPKYVLIVSHVFLSHSFAHPYHKLQETIPQNCIPCTAINTFLPCLFVHTASPSRNFSNNPPEYITTTHQSSTKFGQRSVLFRIIHAAIPVLRPTSERSR